MNSNDENIEALFQQWGEKPDPARQKAWDIQAGDELLARWGQTELPQSVSRKVEAAIRARAAKPTRLRTKHPWRRRMMPLAAALAIAVGVILWWQGQNAPVVPEPSANQQLAQLEQIEGELRLWHLGLAAEGYEQAAQDELLWSEMVIMFEEVNWGSDNTSRKEHCDENYA